MFLCQGIHQLHVNEMRPYSSICIKEFRKALPCGASKIPVKIREVNFDAISVQLNERTSDLLLQFKLCG
jgi:hypothetical protein